MSSSTTSRLAQGSLARVAWSSGASTGRTQSLVFPAAGSPRGREISSGMGRGVPRLLAPIQEKPPVEEGAVRVDSMDLEEDGARTAVSTDLAEDELDATTQAIDSQIADLTTTISFAYDPTDREDSLLRFMTLVDASHVFERDDDRKRRYTLVTLLMLFRIHMCLGMCIPPALMYHPVFVLLLPINAEDFVPSRRTLRTLFRVTAWRRFRPWAGDSQAICIQTYLRSLRSVYGTVEGTLNVLHLYESVVAHRVSHARHGYAVSMDTVRAHLQEKLLALGKLPCALSEIASVLEPSLALSSVLDPSAITPVTPVSAQSKTAEDKDTPDSSEREDADGHTPPRSASLRSSQYDLLPTIVNASAPQARASDVVFSYVSYLWHAASPVSSSRELRALTENLMCHPGVNDPVNVLRVIIAMDRIWLRPLDILLHPRTMFAVDVASKVLLALAAAAAAVGAIGSGADTIPHAVVMVALLLDVTSMPRHGKLPLFDRVQEVMRVVLVVNVLLGAFLVWGGSCGGQGAVTWWAWTSRPLTHGTDPCGALRSVEYALDAWVVLLATLRTTLVLMTMPATAHAVTVFEQSFVRVLGTAIFALVFVAAGVGAMFVFVHGLRVEGLTSWGDAFDIVVPHIVAVVGLDVSDVDGQRQDPILRAAARVTIGALVLVTTLLVVNMFIVAILRSDQPDGEFYMRYRSGLVVLRFRYIQAARQRLLPGALGLVQRALGALGLSTRVSFRTLSLVPSLLAVVLLSVPWSARVVRLAGAVVRRQVHAAHRCRAHPDKLDRMLLPFVSPFLWSITRRRWWERLLGVVFVLVGGGVLLVLLPLLLVVTPLTAGLRYVQVLVRTVLLRRTSWSRRRRRCCGPCSRRRAHRPVQPRPPPHAASAGPDAP